MATIKLSKAQWQFIGKQAGWMKTAQPVNLDIKAAEQMLWEIDRRNKMGGTKTTLGELIELGEVGDAQAVGRAFDMLRSKNLINVEKSPDAQGDADKNNIVSLTSAGQEFLSKRLAQPESATYGDVAKQYAQSQKLVKEAGMETVNALVAKGWAKKLPDGSFARIYWPSDADINDPANAQLKQSIEDGSVKQQPDGSFRLVKDPSAAKPQIGNTPTVLDNTKPMPKVSSKK